MKKNTLKNFFRKTITVIPISRPKIIIFCYKEIYKIFFNIFSACICIEIAQKIFEKNFLSIF